MTPESLQYFQEVVDQLFIRWDALKLAVEHMGGRNGREKAIDIKTYIYERCTENNNIEQSDLRDILDEEIDGEFQTICEDNSTIELSYHLVRFLKLCVDERFDEVRQQLTQLPNCINWLDPTYKLARNDDSDLSSDSDDDYDDEQMDAEDSEAPALVDGSQRLQQTTPEVDADGWTTVTAKRRQR